MKRTPVPSDVSERRLALQARILAHSPVVAGSARRLCKDVLGHMLRAQDKGHIMDAPEHIRKFLRFPSKIKMSDEFTIHGARLDRANFKGDPDQPHFTRSDGAHFDFLIAGRDLRDCVEVLAYSCEVRFPGSSGSLPAVRYDLNPPGHDNETRGMRCHIHPGHDDFQAAAPFMHPLDLIDFCIYGLEQPTKLRTKREDKTE